MGTAVTDLLEPILTGGVRTAFFFNGRMLTAEDLRALQEGIATRQQQLGQAVGEGVVAGLDVRVSAQSTWTRPVVSIRKGLALNRRGDCLALTGDIELGLVAEAAARGVAEGEFEVCDQATVTLTNLGLYVLAVLPASGFEGRVPMTSVGTEGVSSVCGSKYAVAGVRFRLVRVPVPVSPAPGSLAARVTALASELEVLIGQLPPPDQPQPPIAAADAYRKVSLLRSGAAHLAFGTGSAEAFATDPLARTSDGRSVHATYGLVDALRASGAVTDCEVPLALLYWTSQGLRFVDPWAVKRMVAPLPAAMDWPRFSCPRRLTEGAAMVWQFQDQLEELRQTTVPIGPLSGLNAAFYLSYLPPFGLVPLGSPGVRGFDADAFLQSRPHRAAEFIDGAQLTALFAEAVEYPPVDLNDVEMVWLYRVAENARFGVAANAGVVFTTGHLPHRAVARFDVARWDYSSYGFCCEP